LATDYAVILPGIGSSHELDTRRSVRTFISRSIKVPLTVTRSPTCFDNGSSDDAGTMEMDADRLVRNPDFQLRAFGAFSPVVSFRRNSLSERARHPVSVTTAGIGPVMTAGSGSDGSVRVGGLAGDSFGAAVAGVSVRGATGRSAVRVEPSSVGAGGVDTLDANINIATSDTNPNATAGPDVPVHRFERMVFIMPAKLIMPAKFDPRVRFLRSGFFTAILFLLMVTPRTLQKEQLECP
jgi:hypothetical protein